MEQLRCTVSMIGCFRTISPDRLQQLMQEPDQIEDYLFPEDVEDAEGEHLDIDKMWHGLHFLLTGDAEAGDPPWSLVVMGGQEIGDDLGYGAARYLSSTEVANVSQALAGLSVEEFASRFDPNAMTGASIYPSIWSNDETAKEELVQAYADVRNFYAHAARNGQGIMLYLT